ncbi:MAG: universal stress protein [Telluria sp.]
MYKHILVPTDGSALSRRAVHSAILFARELGARITALHVMPAPAADELEAWLHHDPNYAGQREKLFDKFGRACLAYVTDLAASEGVQCADKLVVGQEPYRAIVDTAVQEHCDLVFMSSHGARGGEAQVPGSETLKVIIHSKVPVLVHKPAGAGP